jgi:hypothetical protein
VNRPFGHFFRFLGSVRKRLLVVRLAERIGLAILIACGPALLAAAWLLWHGQPALIVVEVLMASGFIAGVAWAIVRRPTPLAAALEADRQMRLAELLSSAWLSWRAEAYQRDGWAAALLAEADSRSATFAVSSLTLRRFGGRTWGAVALAVSLVMTLALLGPSPQSSTLDWPKRHSNRDLAMGKGQKNEAQKPETFASPENRPILLADPDDLNASQFGQDGLPQAAKPAARSGDSSASASDSHAPSSSDNAGKGRGSARTNNADAAMPKLATGHAAGESAAADKTADPAAGAGDASHNARKDGTSATGGALAGSDLHFAAPPPWKAADWAATIHRARLALDAGQIPPAYRDLVQEYFRASAE